MKSLVEYLNESIVDLKKLAQELINEYADFDEDSSTDLLERAINLILKDKSLNKKEVDALVDEYENIDLDDEEAIESLLEDVMNLVNEIK